MALYGAAFILAILPKYELETQFIQFQGLRLS